MNAARNLIRRLFPAPAPLVLGSIDAYALWAANYPPQAHNALMHAEQAAMLELMPEVSGKIVLDLACGTGRYSLLAQAKGASRVVGIDNSAAMLAAMPTANVLPDRAQATSESIPLASASVDVVLCGLALGHLPHLQPSLDEIARVLKREGQALISDVHPFIALNGAQRTFQSPNGETYAVEHYAHLYADYQQAGANAGLVIDAVREPALDRSPVPVVLVFRFRKAGE
jgi:malonyl-CoA O-methyltransferase